jgi:hypothetical protein
LLRDVRAEIIRVHTRLDAMQAQLSERCSAHLQRITIVEVEQRQMQVSLKGARELAEKRSLAAWQWIVSLLIAGFGWLFAWYRGK